MLTYETCNDGQKASKQESKKERPDQNFHNLLTPPLTRVCVVAQYVQLKQTLFLIKLAQTSGFQWKVTQPLPQALFLRKL